MDNRMSLLTSPFVPEGMVDLMKKLSKGVIKERPSNIYEYAAVFFEKMLIARDGSLDKGYGKFRSYTEYCKFMDKMDQRRLNQTASRQETIETTDTTETSPDEMVLPSNIEVQGVAIQGVERKSKDSVKNVSINPKYKSQSEKVTKPVASNVKSVKAKPRKLSSKKPSESLIVIKEETSADVDDNGNGEFNLNRAAETIQRAFRMYRSKRNSEDERFVASGKVSNLSENAAALIIQKAFKSLIQKLQPSAPKTDDESNKNIVIPVVADQKADAIDDEHKESTKQDVEFKVSPLEDATETVTTSELELNDDQLVESSDVVNASMPATQPTEIEEIQTNEFTSTESASDDLHNSPAADIKESHYDQDVISPHVNETTIPLDESPPDINSNEFQEIVPDEISTVELQQNESTNRAEGAEIELVENVTADSKSELKESNESQVDNVSDNNLATAVPDGSQAEAETKEDEANDQLETTSDLKPLTIVAVDKEIYNISNESEQAQNTTIVTEKESNVEHSPVTDSGETLVLLKTQESPSQSVASSEVDTNQNRLKNNIEEDSSTDVVDGKQVENMEEKVVEPHPKEQLFVVEKDGIYVNMDLLQEKFDGFAIDDGTGNDSEKSFKLNILEREEILVNQENVQPIVDELLTTDDDNIDKNSEQSNIATVKNTEIDDEMESTENNMDIKDEDGNEEYELAETVVLVDIPSSISKSYRENEHLLSMTTNGTESGGGNMDDENQELIAELKVAKQNKLNDEFDKLDSKTVESMKMLDCVVADNNQTTEEKPVAQSDSSKILKKDNVVGDVENELEIFDDQLKKSEDAKPISEKVSNSEEVSTKEKDADGAQTKNEREQDEENVNNETEVVEAKQHAVNHHVISNEDAHETSNSEGISKEENITEVSEVKQEDVKDQLNKVEESLEKSNSEGNLKEENVTEVMGTEQEDVKDQLNKVEESLEKSNSEGNLKEENVTEVMGTEQEDVKDQLNKVEESLEKSNSEGISKEENVTEVVGNEQEDVKDQLNKVEESLEKSNSEGILKEENVTEESPEKLNSDGILKKENVTEVVEAKQKDVKDQLDKMPESPEKSNSERVLKEENVSAVVRTKREDVSDALTNMEETPKKLNSEGILKDQNVNEVAETKQENPEVQMNKSEEAHETSNSEKNYIKEVATKQDVDDQINKSGDAALDDKIKDSAATTQHVTKTENQLSENDEADVDKKLKETEAAEEIELSMNGAQMVIKGNDKSDQLIERNEHDELIKAATIIQKVFRGYVVRNSQTERKSDSNKNQLELSAALIIQKYVRGYLVRRQKQNVNKRSIVQVTSNQIAADEKETNTNTEDNSINAMAPQLPPYSNRFLIPKDSFLERESFADDEDYARTCKELAATSIQKTYRGYRVRRSLKSTSEAETDLVRNEADAGTEDVREYEVEDEIQSAVTNDKIETVVTEADRVITAVLSVAADVLPQDTYDSDSFEEDASENKTVELKTPEKSSNDRPSEPRSKHESILGQVVQDNIHVEGQMQQKFNQMSFQDSTSTFNRIEEMSDSSEHPETPRIEATENVAKTAAESVSVDSKYDGVKSFSYEQLSSDISDTEESKRDPLKESEIDETSRDERDELSEVENFDLSSCGEDSLEAMYYSLRKNEIMVDRMQKQVAEQRDPSNDELLNTTSDHLKIEFPERVTENLDIAMQQVFKSLESSSDCDGGKKDEDDSSSTLDLGLDDSSSINDEKEIETSRQVKRPEEMNLEDNERSESTSDVHAKDDSQSSEINFVTDTEMNQNEQSQHSDSSVNSSTRFIMKSQSVSEDMMNPIMFAMKRKQALLDQLHVRPYPLQENLSEDHDAFPEHLLSDIDIGNIQRKIFASSVSETDSDYVEPNVTNRRLVRDDFNISTALDHLSTDSDSTIVSAATKIQAGARGFLTRRRLRRSSAGGTSISFEKRYSFGNAAIDKSLEDLIKRQEQINLDGAALKIQQQYRRYQARKNVLKKVSPIREQTMELSGGSSVEGMDDNLGIREITFAQKKVDNEPSNVEETNNAHPISLNIDEVDTVRPVKRTPVNQRRLTLQRGDAVQLNSRPDSQDLNGKEANTGNRSNEKFKDSETGEYTGTHDSKPDRKVTAYINIQSLINRGIGPRQRSMPVQIDSELMRIIPKHLRKRVKSADIAKKKSN